jgi:hypothetical protein
MSPSNKRKLLWAGSVNVNKNQVMKEGKGMSSHHSLLSFSRALISLMMTCGLIIGIWTRLAYAFPENHWVLQSGEQLEVLRDFVCFGEDKAGERTAYKIVTFQKGVLSAEVFLSGFNIWQTRGGDSEVAQIRVDAWVNVIGVGKPGPPGTRGPGLPDPKNVSLKFMYSLKDEDPSGSEDFNDACIGFTVIAKTK